MITPPMYRWAELFPGTETECFNWLCSGEGGSPTTFFSISIVSLDRAHVTQSSGLMCRLCLHEGIYRMDIETNKCANNFYYNYFIAIEIISIISVRKYFLSVMYSVNLYASVKYFRCTRTAE